MDDQNKSSEDPQRRTPEKTKAVRFLRLWEANINALAQGSKTTQTCDHETGS